MGLAEDIIAGKTLTEIEAVSLCLRSDTAELFAAADAVRTHFFGDRIETCSIINARSGRCPENCKWCAQSAFNKTSAAVYPLMGEDEIFEAAREFENAGVNRFSIVTSGRAQSGDDFESIVRAFSKMKCGLKIGLCGSLGLLDKPHLERLRDAGMTRYHCNLETAPSYFPKLCSTHTIADKIQTIRWAKELGLEVCSGGIIGMGESLEQRVELAAALRDLRVDSIPLNILNPIKGTPLEDASPLNSEEILKAFAIFKLMNPKAQIRFAGGRILMGALQEKALRCGVSAAIVGDMLTTVGAKLKEDFEMFERLGYEFK